MKNKAAHTPKVLRKDAFGHMQLPRVNIDEMNNVSVIMMETDPDQNDFEMKNIS